MMRNDALNVLRAKGIYENYVTDKVMDNLIEKLGKPMDIEIDENGFIFYALDGCAYFVDVDDYSVMKMQSYGFVY